MSVKSVSSHSLEEEVTAAAEVATTNLLDESSPRPRLCHLKKWPDFQGYGFNLHAERSKLQQQIGKVDPDSPAETAGLKEKDRIIEVNYVNISNENHQQVVNRIRGGLKDDDGVLYPDQVVLLVLDPEADEYYKKLNIVVRHDMSNVLKMTTPDREQQQPPEQVLQEDTTVEQDDNSTIQQPEASTLQDELTDAPIAKESDLNNNEQLNKTATNSTSSLSNSQQETNNLINESKKSTNSSETTSPIQSQNSTLNRTSNNAFPKDEIFNVHAMIKSSESKLANSQSEVEFRHRPPRPPPPSAHSYRTSTVSTYTQAEQLDRFLEMSAAEFKSYLKSKGRHDPRVMTLDMKRKHEIFQNM